MIRCITASGVQDAGKIMSFSHEKARRKGRALVAVRGATDQVAGCEIEEVFPPVRLPNDPLNLVAFAFLAPDFQVTRRGCAQGVVRSRGKKTERADYAAWLQQKQF